MPTNVTTSAETNLITKTQMAKVREVDFVNRFSTYSLAPLLQALGVTRKIPMQEGTTMYVYTTSGTLQSGAVGEGEIIPLSQYARSKSAVGDITLNKWRKATSAEAIKKSGYQEAVNETDKKMLQDIQTGIRTAFFDFIDDVEGATTANADTLQALIAKHWAMLQVKFENDAIEAVHFIHPLTVAEYLGVAQISTQTAFGMTYLEDFLGMGTVVLTPNVDQGVVISTAKDNLILYYIPMSGEIASAFNLTSDESGYIGAVTTPNNTRAQIELMAMSGVQFLVEYAQGVIIGEVGASGETGA